MHPVSYLLPDLGLSRAGAVAVIPAKGDVIGFGPLAARVAERWVTEPGCWTLYLTPISAVGLADWEREGFSVPPAATTGPPWKEV